MHWEYDENRMPLEPTMEKASFDLRERTFGTLFTAARARPSFDLERDRPEVYRGYQTRDSWELPAKWNMKWQWYSTEWNEGAYIACWLETEHDLKIPDAMPPEVTHQLSAHLLLGERINFRNFRNLQTGASLKYLPFLITGTHYRYFVYEPTREHIARALALFEDSLQKVRAIEHHICPSLPDLYALVRLDEVRAATPAIDPIYDEVHKSFVARMGQGRQLGFLYRDLPGTQDARDFFYEINGKRVESE